MGSAIEYKPTKYDSFVSVAQDGSGDFNGADETPIQNAINSISSTGGTILIKKGTYLISNSITLSSNIKLIGEGFATKLHGNAAVNVIEATDVSNIIIENILIDGLDTSNSGIRIIYSSTGSDNIIINNVQSNQGLGYGIYAEYATNVLISNCICNDNSQGVTEGRGIYLTNCDDSTISSCICNDNKRYGIMLHTPNRIKIIGCTANDNEGDRGIYSYEGSDVVIDGCTANSNNFSGITMAGKNGIVSNCISKANTLDGILVRKDSGSALINNITIIGNDVSDNLRYGIHIDQNIYDFNVTKNCVNNNGDVAIRVSNTCARGFVDGNICAENGGHAVHLTTDVDNVIVNNNYGYHSTGVSGMWVVRIGDSTCENNVIGQNYNFGYINFVYDAGTTTTYGISVETITATKNTTFGVTNVDSDHIMYFGAGGSFRFGRSTGEYIETTQDASNINFFSTGKPFNIGSSDTQAFNLKTNNNTRLQILSDGTLNFAGNSIINAPNISTINYAAGVPSNTPDKIGRIYVDTTAGNIYISKGTTSSADWVQVN